LPTKQASAASFAEPPPVARPPAATSCKHSAFREHAFTGKQGRIHLAQGRLHDVKANALVISFREIHPEAPRSLAIYLNMDEFQHAVKENDIAQILIERSVPAVRLKPTIQAK
jgi:hypothetical protein